MIEKLLKPLLVIINVGPPAESVVASGSVIERLAAVKVTFCTLLEALVSVREVPCDTVEAPPATLGVAGVELTQVVPLEVSKLPLVLGATKVGVDVPAPKITLLAERVPRPVPPEVTPTGVTVEVIPALNV